MVCVWRWMRIESVSSPCCSRKALKGDDVVPYDIGPVLDRPAQVGGGEGVVHDQGCAGVVVCHLGDAGEVVGGVLRVRDRLREQQVRRRTDFASPLLEARGVLNEVGLDTEACVVDPEERASLRRCWRTRGCGPRLLATLM